MVEIQKFPLGFKCKCYSKEEIFDPKNYFRAKKAKRDAENIMRNPQTIRRIILNEANAKLKGIYNEMKKAVEENNFEKLKELVEKNNRVEFPYRNDKSLLYIACEKGNYKIVEFLIEKGAEINRKLLAMNKTCIMASVQMGNFDIVKLLIEKGADVNTRDKKGNNALLLSVIWEYPEIFEFLLNNAKADPLVNEKIDPYLLKLVESKQSNKFETILERWLIGNV